MFHKTQLRFDHDRIFKTFQDIYKDELTPLKKSQWMITGDGSDDAQVGTGRAEYVSGYEADYCHLLNVYKGTYIEQVHDELSQHYDLFRVRFMMQWPKRCYSYHRDPTPRFHIPVTPNEHSWMIVEKNIFEFEAGWTYLVDTTLPHSALNMGSEPRLHIVGGYKEK